MHEVLLTSGGDAVSVRADGMILVGGREEPGASVAASRWAEAGRMVRSLRGEPWTESVATMDGEPVDVAATVAAALTAAGRPVQVEVVSDEGDEVRMGAAVAAAAGCEDCQAPITADGEAWRKWCEENPEKCSGKGSGGGDSPAAQMTSRVTPRMMMRGHSFKPQPGDDHRADLFNASGQKLGEVKAPGRGGVGGKFTGYMTDSKGNALGEELQGSSAGQVIDKIYQAHRARQAGSATAALGSDIVGGMAKCEQCSKTAAPGDMPMAESPVEDAGEVTREEFDALAARVAAIEEASMAAEMSALAAAAPAIPSTF